MKKSTVAVLAGLMAAPLFAGRPVAAWDVVPYQRVTGVFKAGVVAFHDKDVRVEFTVNGKRLFLANEAIVNERTGVKEFVVNFPSAKLSSKLGDRAYTLGAKVLVEGEAPYVLPELPVYSNDSGTLGSKNIVWVDSKKGNEFADGSENAPVKSLAQGVKKAGDGGTVYLKAGTYSLKMLGGGLERKYWTLITSAPGVDRSDVKLTSGRPGTDKLYFKDLDFSCNVSDGGYGTIIMGEDSKSMAWFDNCTFTNIGGRDSGESYPFGNKLVAYITGGSTTDMSTGPVAALVRNHTVKTVSCRAFPGSDALVVNCSAEDVKPSDSSKSSDFIGAVPVPPKKWASDLILYGLKASNVDCQAFNIQLLRDSAFVDVSLTDVSTDNAIASCASDEVVNVLFSNFSLPGQTWKWRYSKYTRGDFKPTDVIIKNSVFGKMEGYEVRDGSKGLELRDTVVEKAE